MTLRHYAGFDPDEDNFDNVELAPLHARDLIKPPRQFRTSMDIERARHLKSLGQSWAEVGRQLAIEAGRTMPYHGPSVRLAVRSGYFIQDRMTK